MKLFVGGSCQDNLLEEFYLLAQDVGKLFKNQEIVLGGSKKGMVQYYDKFVPKCNITRILLKDYYDESYNYDEENLVFCDTSFQRITKIWQNSDVFLILPGGLGTLGEIVVFLEENRTMEKCKKIILFNNQNFYDMFLQFLQFQVKNNFVDESIFNYFIVVETIEELKKEMEEFL